MVLEEKIKADLSCQLMVRSAKDELRQHPDIQKNVWEQKIEGIFNSKCVHYFNITINTL